MFIDTKQNSRTRAKTAHHKQVFCLFGIRAKTTRFTGLPLFTSVCLLSTSILIPACGSSESKRDDSRDRFVDQGPGVFDENAPLDIPDATDESLQWSIILATLPNERVARDALTNIKANFGLNNAYVAPRQGKSVVAIGRYDGPNDRQALLDLDQIREITNGTSRPFASAFLAPPSGDALGGSNSEYDLRTVKERFGPTALYTLQLGVYGTDDQSTPNPEQIKDFRAAAEQAVLELRAEGERAFYYHGPFQSMVTVGVFGVNDFDASTMPAIESSRLKALREKYPYNYLNGKGIRETISTASGQRITRLQPSSLVGIP
ncbi:MAG: hypothetical protein JJ974_00005, partial [Phycisphaerales bacterium]|nr:hypothetical protein [Phycisphaerales bacterium]